MSTGPAATPSPLGQRVWAFRPSRANAAFALALGLLMAVAGLVIFVFIAREIYRAGGDLPFHDRTGRSWLAAGIGSVFGGLLVFVCVLQVQDVRHRFTNWVELYANGFRYHSGEAAEEVLWGEVALIREIVRFEMPFVVRGLANLLLPKVASRRYAVLTKAGKEYDFNRNVIEDMRRFGQYLRELTRYAGVPWEKGEAQPSAGQQT